MSCDRWRASLMDVALGAPASPEIERHLAACADCRAVLDGQRDLLGRIDREIHATLDTAPSTAFSGRVRQRVVEQRAAPTPWLWRWPAPAALAAGVLAVAVLAVGFGLGGHRTSPTTARGAGPTPSQVAGLEPTQPSVAPQATAALSPLHRRARFAHRSPPQRTALVEPEVLVPPGQAAIVRRLAMALRNEAVEPDSFLAANFKLGEPQTMHANLPASVVRSYPRGSDETTIRAMDVSSLTTESMEWRNQS